MIDLTEAVSPNSSDSEDLSDASAVCGSLQTVVCVANLC